LVSARDTVETETPAALANSSSVTGIENRKRSFLGDKCLSYAFILMANVCQVKELFV